MHKVNLLLLIPILIYSSGASSQTVKVTKYENIVFGMASGAAMLMDIYQPSNANHLGIVVIQGSGFGTFASTSYNEDGLKESYTDDDYLSKSAKDLVNRGYTIFMINHRFAPIFRYPTIFYDCQRAVRFIRFNANKYGINPAYIGALGHSSGAILAASLGVKDTTIANAENGIDSISSKVQAVVTLAADFNLADIGHKEVSDSVVKSFLIITILNNYIGELPPVKKGEFVMIGKYAEASPIYNVTKDDAAFLMYYSDNDPYTPIRQGFDMYHKLQENNVPAKLVLKTMSAHHPVPDITEMDMWFRKYLKTN
jgi:acetyl esterase/lipase